MINPAQDHAVISLKITGGGSSDQRHSTRRLPVFLVPGGPALSLQADHVLPPTDDPPGDQPKPHTRDFQERDYVY